jgi:hypothetical protein
MLRHARVRGDSHPRIGLRGGGHRVLLSLEYPARELHLGEWHVQRSLQHHDRHGDLPEHGRVQLVDVQRDAETLRRLFG